MVEILNFPWYHWYKYNYYIKVFLKMQQMERVFYDWVIGRTYLFMAMLKRQVQLIENCH